MQERRARILLHARQLIMAGGIEALSVRTLADAADVAVRTIYRSIGTKDEVLIALFSETQVLYEQRVGIRTTRDPLAMVEATVLETAGLFAEDEEYYRASYLAMEHLYELKPRPEAISSVFERGENVFAAGFKACIKAGLLKGNISAGMLANLALQAQRSTLKDWTSRNITLQDLRAETLLHIHLILMVDANASFHAELLEKVKNASTASVKAPFFIRSTP